MKQGFPLIATAACLCLASAIVTVATPAGGQPPGLRPAESLVCTGNRTLTLRGRYIATDGNAAEIDGNCEVYIIDSHLVGGGVGVRASGNAEVFIVRSTIEGARGSLWVDGNATISFADSEIYGRTTASGSAELIDDGGNTIAGRGDRRHEDTSGDRRSEDSVRIGGIEIGSGGVKVGGVVIDESGVDVGEGAVVVDERGVEVGRGAVVVGEDGVDVGGGAVVVGEDGVDVGEGAVVVDEAGNVRIADGVPASSDWRRQQRSGQDTDRVLVELGAVTENDRIRLELAGDILFDFGRADIRAAAAVRLSKVAHLIRRKAVGQVTVFGHTDSIGSADANLELSRRRALSVIRWLHQQEGIPAELMAARGLGETQPIAHNTMPDGSDNPEGRARNRRVEIRIATTD